MRFIKKSSGMLWETIGDLPLHPEPFNLVKIRRIEGQGRIWTKIRISTLLRGYEPYGKDAREFMDNDIVRISARCECVLEAQ